MGDARRRPDERIAPGAFTALLAELAAAPPLPEGTGAAALRPGTAVARFEVVRELGRGGFGVVYEARDRELGRSVALKLVRPGRARLGEAQLAREAEAIARLSHRNIVTLHEVGRGEQGPYLVFELLRGAPLQERLDAGPLSVREAVRIAVDIAGGLAHAHAEGVVHRDLNPSNVFLCQGGGTKLLDFGMAHAFGRRRISGGTPAFMAPEQLEGAPEDERTDVFALGVLLYRMLAGELPFSDERRLEAPGAAPALEVADAPALGALVGWMLQQNPVRRPRDGGEVLEALERVEADLEARRSAGGVVSVHGRRPPGEDPGTESAEARREYLVGQQLMRRGTLDGYRRAARAFENATSLDPGYASAHAGLANALVWQWRHRWVGDRARLEARAIAAAEAAIALGPARADARLARARVRLAQLDWAGARADVDEARRLRPDDPWVLRLDASLLAIAGRLDDAIASTRQAIAADPLDAYAWASLAWYELARAPHTARDVARRTLEISPEFDAATGILAIAYVLEGRPADALATSLRCGGFGVRLFGAALAHHDLGHAAEARRALDALVARAGGGLPYRVAEVYAWRSEPDRAFEWLDRAVAWRDPTLGDVREDPLLRRLHPDARYGALLERLRVPR